MPLPRRAVRWRERPADGFTLVELLVVVVVGVLAAIAVPVYLGVRADAVHGAVEADVAHLRVAESSLATSESPPVAFGPLDGTKATPDALPDAWREAGATLGTSTARLSFAPVDGADRYRIRASAADGDTWYATARAVGHARCSVG